MNDKSHLIQMRKINLFHKMTKFSKDLIKVLKLSVRSLFLTHKKKKVNIIKPDYSYVMFPQALTSFNLFIYFLIIPCPYISLCVTLGLEFT